LLLVVATVCSCVVVAPKDENRKMRMTELRKDA